MKIGEGLIVAEEPRLRHEIRHHVARPGCFRLEIGKMLVPERRRDDCRILNEELLEPGRPVCRRHPGEGQVTIRLEMTSRLLEGRPAFLVHQPGGRVSPDAFGIGDGRSAVGFNMQRPAGAEPAEEIVHACGDGDEFLRRQTFKVRAAIGDGALEAAILVEDDAGCDEAGPFEMVCQRGRAGAVLSEVQHAQESFLRPHRTAPRSTSRMRMICRKRFVPCFMTLKVTHQLFRLQSGNWGKSVGSAEVSGYPGSREVTSKDRHENER